jgi:laccase
LLLHVNFEGAMEESFVLDVERGKTYLLRLINAALMSEYYLKIAGHKFTVVSADANYVNPYTTDIIVIAPGETVDALLVADAPPGRYYMVALANQPSIANPPVPKTITRGTSNDPDNGVAGHGSRSCDEGDEEAASNNTDVPSAPEMPSLHDMAPSYYFHGNLTSSRRSQQHRRSVPAHVDERLIVPLSVGSVCRHGQSSCKRSGCIESIIVVTMNNVSFQIPDAATVPLLEAHYHGCDGKAAGMELYTLPDRPPMPFNFTDAPSSRLDFGPIEARPEPTEKAMTARRFRHVCCRAGAWQL